MVNCTDPPSKAASDAGVAGTGVLLSFIITAIISLALSASLIFGELRRARRPGAKPSTVRRKLLNAYSDQQIMTGIGIQVVGLAQMDAMVPYHFFLIWMLSLLSMAVHNATLLALVHDFRRDWVLRWLRQALMFASLGLSSVYGAFMLRAVQRGLTESTLPIACVWDPAAAAATGPPGPALAPAPDVGLSYFGTVAVMAGNALVFAAATWYLHSRRQRLYRATQLAGLALMAASAVGAMARVFMLSQAFGTPSVPLADDGESRWSFGAWLSVGLLLLPVVSVIEILRGEVQCAPPVADDDGAEHSKLLSGAGGMAGNELSTFQPNPFWGSRTDMSKK